MNDLDLIDKFGPETHAPSDAAIGAARARLDAATAHPAGAVRRPRRIVLLVAAAAAAVGIAVTPALIGSDDSIALAAVDPLTFPLTPTWLPNGVGEPVFSSEPAPGLRDVTYQGSGDDRVKVALTDPERTRKVGEDAEVVDVNGVAGRAFDSRGDDGSTPSFTVQWDLGDKVVSVTGKAAFADPSVVERIADSVRERPQPVDLFLTVAPSGWQVFGYQSDHHITYYDPRADQGGEETDLTLCLCPESDADFDAFGARDVHEVSVDGRAGRLGHTVDMDGNRVNWVMESTAPDGRTFTLSAPGALTDDQVIEIADGVRHR